MKKVSLILVAAVIAAVLAGCSTSTVTMYRPYEGQKSENGRQVVSNLEGDNWGLYLFYFIPIWSGNQNLPNRSEFKMFSNRIQDKYMDLMLRRRADVLKADLEDVEISRSSSGFFSLWIIWRRSHHGTAAAVKRAGEKEKKPAPTAVE